MKARIESLDWLRGLMAIAIMFYHLAIWFYFPRDATTLLGRLGIYGVSIFFILSGLSMAIVYTNFIKDMKTSGIFMIRRIFRIWPLLWVCVALVVSLNFIRNGSFDLLKIISNLTTLFGFINPGGAINTGAWSIGNEMVYYALTPVIFLLYNRKKVFGDIFTLVSFLVCLVFAFLILNPKHLIANQWSIYINPFNNLFFYCAGISIFYNLKDVIISQKINSVLFCAGCAIFLFYPVSGDQIDIITGPNRIIFILASILVVISFYKFDLYSFVPGFVGFSLEKFGIATYGVYMLHPIVKMYSESVFKRIGVQNKEVQLVSVVIVTIVIAIASFSLFEKKMIQIGKKLTTPKNK